MDSVTTTLATVACVLLVGCSSPADLARTDEASESVWSIYGETSRPPAILWVWQSELNCARGAISGRAYAYYAGAHPGEVAADGSCVAGQTFFDGETTAQLALPDDTNFSGLALSHEFLHAHLDHVTGDPDYQHANPGFGEQYGHASGGLVDQANGALREKGL